MAFVEKDGLRYYQFESFKGLGVFHAVLTREGGYSKAPFKSLNFGGTVGDDPEAVLKNHQKVFRVLNFNFQSRFDVWQVHGTNIICTDSPRELNENHQKADGILTDNPKVTLFMRFADCVPILLMDPVKRVIGIVHAGWQGTANKIAQKAIKALAECYGSNPADVMASVGPSICQECYQVGSEVFEAFRKSFGLEGEKFFSQNHHHFYLDLWEANRFTLEQACVEQIEVAGLCTACHQEDWFSHRGGKGKTGRFGVLMSLHDPESPGDA